ncbi:MAG: hypothetical protein JL50_21245 [Peptococcaceae bacterium BICA1-7]|nr:MAG: hypothetical protein JL50_21245 [Peptococcaceae bacterium BICA1-7]HBV97145.1 universal stress protein [Desulfotomaculum sp.]
MSKVLVAFDGSESAVKAANYAAEMFLKDPAIEVTVLTVVNIPNLNIFGASLDMKEKFMEALNETGNSTLDKAKKIFDEKNIPVKAIIEQGDPSTIINIYAHNNAIDIIIMGTRGLTRLKGMVLGSVSQKLIHITDRPVMLIK